MNKFLLFLAMMLAGAGLQAGTTISGTTNGLFTGTTSSIRMTGTTTNAGVMTGGTFTNASITGTTSWATASGTATTSGTGTYAATSGTAVTSGSASYATLSGSAATSGTGTYAATSGSAATSGTALYATTSGSASTSGTGQYARLSGTATYATTSGSASTSGTAQYATTSGSAATSGTAQYAASSGTAATSGTATYATLSGSATTSGAAATLTGTQNTIYGEWLAKSGSAAQTMRIAADALKGPYGLNMTQQRVYQIDYNNAGRLAWISVGDSMGTLGLGGPFRDWIESRYGIRGAALSGLSILTSGSVSQVDDYTVWETGDPYQVRTSGTITWGQAVAGAQQYMASTSWSVYVIEEPTGGTYTVQYQPLGGAWTTQISGSSATYVSGTRLAVKSFTLSEDMYKIRLFTTSGTVRVIGARGENTGRPGVVSTYVARGGLPMSSEMIVSGSMISPVIADIAPDLVIFHQKDNLSDYPNYAPTVLQRWLSVTGSATDYCLLGTTQTSGTDTDTPLINVWLANYANSQGWAYFDCNQAVGGWAGINRVGWGSPDPVHLDIEASNFLASVFGQQFGLDRTTQTKQLLKTYGDGNGTQYSFGTWSQDAGSRTLRLLSGSASSSILSFPYYGDPPGLTGMGFERRGKTGSDAQALMFLTSRPGYNWNCGWLSGYGNLTVGLGSAYQEQSMVRAIQGDGSFASIEAIQTGGSGSAPAIQVKPSVGGTNSFVVTKDGSVTALSLTLQSGTTTAPSNTATPVGWATFTNANGTFKIPLYQ